MMRKPMGPPALDVQADGEERMPGEDQRRHQPVGKLGFKLRMTRASNHS